ncbi:MAG TPA: PAS domain S-box protein [Deltaproteobacteria bacterium]|nr:PAS domain S-box protein [Deltaproteobacteria bacterium]
MGRKADEDVGSAPIRPLRSRSARRVERDAGYALVDEMRDGICLLDEEGRILHVNPSFVALLGGSPDGWIGSDPLLGVHPEDRRRVANLFRPGARARRKGALVYRMQSARGAALQLEATAREFTDGHGRLRVVVGIRDVTERENARRALERHVELETRVAEISRFFVDLEIGAIQQGIESRLAAIAGLADAQHSWMYSFSTGVEEGPELFDWWREEVGERAPVPATRAIAAFPYSTSRIMSGQVYQVTDVDALPPEADRERQDMLARGVRSILGIPIMSGGRFVGFLGFECFDRENDWPEETIMLLRMVGEIFYSALRRRRAALDLRHSQSQLMQSQKMEAIGRLAGGIAHDFNNHLAVMLTNARFVRQEIDAEPEVFAAIEDFERSADHCAQLTRSLLAFSRRSPAEIVPVEVAEVVEGVEALVRPLLPSGIRLETVLARDLGFFRVDRVQMQQVLVNLLVNARDAMPEGGAIRMHACRRPLALAEAAEEGLDGCREYVVITVEDTGIGMDEETRERAVEPFFTTKEIGRGTGLGLAMAYGIVREAKGSISIASEPGEGTTLRVFLPAVEADPKDFDEG